MVLWFDPASLATRRFTVDAGSTVAVVAKEGSLVVCGGRLLHRNARLAAPPGTTLGGDRTRTSQATKPQAAKPQAAKPQAAKPQAAKAAAGEDKEASKQQGRPSNPARIAALYQDSERRKVPPLPAAHARGQPRLTCRHSRGGWLGGQALQEQRRLESLQEFPFQPKLNTKPRPGKAGDPAVHSRLFVEPAHRPPPFLFSIPRISHLSVLVLTPAWACADTQVPRCGGAAAAAGLGATRRELHLLAQGRHRRRSGVVTVWGNGRGGCTGLQQLKPAHGLGIR